MLADLFSALDCNQIGWMSFLMWVTPILIAGVNLTSTSWGQSTPKIFLSILSTNSESNQKTLPGLPLFVFALMGFILLMNLLGMIPFVYGVTTNIWIAISMALVFWSMVVFSGWTKYPKESAAHLCSPGTPTPLVPPIIAIETVSLLIRPLTLTLRLVANISAGHIIMGLIANAIASMELKGASVTLMALVGYNMFELFVAFIQAYVFALLIKLYAEEHPTPS